MKKTVSIQVGVMLILVLLFSSSCQPTPIEEAVVNKEDGIYEVKLEQAQAESADNQEEVVPPVITPSAGDIIDKHWKENVELKNFSFCIDIDVDAPNVGSFPVYSVTASEFKGDDQRAQSLLAYFLKDIVALRQGGPTQEDYYKEIQILLRGVYDEDAKAYIAPDETEVEDDIAELMTEAETAPAADDFNPAAKLEKINIPMSIAYKLKSGDEWDIQLKPQQLTITKLPGGIMQPERWVLAGNALPSEPKGTQLKDIKIPQSEVESIVADFFEKTSIGEFSISAIEKARIVDSYTYETLTEGWSVECVRNSGDCFPFAYQRYKNGNGLRFSDTAYASELPLETFSMFIDESGIKWLTWTNPLEIIEQLTTDIELIPFEEMKDIIRQTIKNSLSWAGDNEHGSKLGDGKVTRIVLSSCYIPQKDSPGYYYLTPTWFVLLGFDAMLEQGALEQAIAINAVDGSRIEIKSRG